MQYYDPKKGSLRVVLPRELVGDNLEIPLDELQMGIRYGYEFEKLKVKSISSDELTRAFHDEDIFTLEDINQKRQAAIFATMRLSGLVLSDLLSQISQEVT